MTKTEKRVVRKPLFKRGPQAINGDKDPGYHYRFVNDDATRIQNFKEAGYELVQNDDLSVGDSSLSAAGDLGTAKRVVSKDGTTSYLMRIKKEYYSEDQDAKLETLKEQESTMKRDASQGMYGSIKIS